MLSLDKQPDTRKHLTALNCRYKRNANGQGIIEGVAGLAIIIAGVVLCTFLLLNVGLTAYYKEKIGFVANQTAILTASGQNTDAAATANLQALILTLGPNYSQAAKQASAKVTAVTVNKQSGYQVQITVPQLPLLVNGGVLPGHITVTDTAVATNTVSSSSIPWLANTPGYVAIMISNDSILEPPTAKTAPPGQVPYGKFGTQALLVPLIKNPMPTSASIYSSAGMNIYAQYNPSGP